MKHFLLAFLTLALFSTTKAASEPKVIKTKVDNVTVYLNGAQLQHTGTVSLPAGTSVVAVKKVSSKIERESIRAMFSNDVKVLAVSYEQDKVTSGHRDSVRLEKILDTLDKIDREKRRIIAVNSSLEAERQAILTNSDLRGEKNSVAEIMKLAEFYRLRVAEINRQLYLNAETSADYNRLIDKYNIESSRLRNVVKVEYFYQILLTVYAPGPVTSTLNMRYLAGGAAWTPKYDIRTDGADAGINIDYNANVMNQSGESWEDVKITLSTADPMQSHELPSLQPWTLNFGNTRSNGEGRLNEYGPKKVSKEEAQRNYGNIKVLDGVEFEEIEISNVAVDFDIKGKYDIPSDSKPYLLEVATYKLNAVFQYFAIPKVDKDAFLLAQITGWEKLNLIEGQTNIYFRGTYIGHSYIKPQYANDTLDISMGRDNKVMVNRIKVEDKDAQKVLGTMIKETFTYKITVRNTNSTAVSVEIIDQIPVSQNNEIEVTEHNLSGATVDVLSGQLKWLLDLKPFESRELTISFSVKYPKSKPIRVVQSDRISQRKVRAKF